MQLSQHSNAYPENKVKMYNEVRVFVTGIHHSLLVHPFVKIVIWGQKKLAAGKYLFG
ncbi:hypothetical protein [Longitalea arenae]|uniref:hypothetical protein n=1 Tax=Longitalea arenae TaxID=2812558 RepID=UPI0019688B1F|nr:hypothetical protein [Longitalea arenae]